MTLPDDDFVFDPGEADSTHDLEIALCALLLRDANAVLRPLAGPLRFDPYGKASLAHVEAPIASAFIARAEQIAPLCQLITQRHERDYLRAHAYLTQLAQERDARAAFLQGFAARTTYVGSDSVPTFSSLLGWIDDDPGQPLSLSRDAGLLILGAGTQGAGKTLASTVLCEACLHAQEPLTSPTIPPTCYAFFHVEEHDRLPQLLDGLKPNPSPRELAILMERLGVGPLPVGPLTLAVPQHLIGGLAERLRPYQDLGLHLMALRVQLGKLGQPALEAALGADTGARFIQRMLDNAQQQGEDLDITPWHQYIDDTDELTASQKRAAHTQLFLLDQVASPPGGPGLWDMYGPNRATVAYLGGPHMGRRHVLPLVVGMLNGLMMPSEQHGEFQRVIMVDEVNLFDEDRQAWKAFTRAGRMVRHLGSTLGLFGQDLMHVTDELFGLAGLVLVGKLRNPRVFEHIRERVASLRGRRFEDVKDRLPGELIVGASEATDPVLRCGSCMLKTRPLRCEHGGRTRTMI